jgi:hypothetical protein
MCAITPVSHIPPSREITMRAHRHFFSVSLLVSTMACLFAALLSLSSAGPASSLPPRPETPTPEMAADPLKESGAHIQLRVTPSQPGLFTTVEWQDNEGHWRLVEGWQGDLDDPGGQTKTWWVSPSHSNCGPFRWVVYDRRGGEVLAVSQPFRLPGRSATLAVEIALSGE